MRRLTSSGLAPAAVLISTCLAALPLAAPITKNGVCDPSARYDAPSGENWGQFPVKPSPTSQYRTGSIQTALTPQQSANCIEVPAGLKAELWASEEMSGSLSPGLNYLQHFSFDERGRLWAVEPRSYPNIIRTASNSVTDQKFQGGLDRILILEDTDGDKVMDKVKVFRDGLNMPQGIEVVNGGVVVAMVPYVAFFPNVNDTSGTPQILFSGMGPNGNTDTHSGINSLMYGLDNWIYGHTGGKGCNTQGVDCGWGKSWRFRHTALGHSSTQFQSWTGGPANAWGIGQMEDGQIFQSGATTSIYFSHSVRRGVQAVPLVTASEVFYPLTGDRYMWEGSTGKTNNVFTSRTSAVSGLQFYTSRLLPQKYWNRFAFSCEGATKLCNQDSLVVSTNGSNTGSTWKVNRLPAPNKVPNLIASTDAWVAPILAKTGPDGAVWVLDWYNYLFLHNPATPKGDGEAWTNHLREKKHSRIWRVTPADGSTETVLNLANASVAQLVATFSNPNMLWRLHAQRLLQKKGWSAELGDLLRPILETDRSVDAVDNNPRVVHALWTLHGLNRFTADTAWNAVLANLLKHPAWGVRRNALMAMPRTAASAASIGANCSVNDPHGHVRLQALVALSEISSKPSGLPAMWDTYRTVDTIAQGAFTASGITSSATKGCEPVLFPVSVPKAARLAQPRSDLRIVPTRDGFGLEPHGQLPDGELTVADAKGRAVFRSAYRAREGRWTVPAARGLKPEVYFYAFRGADGALMQGRITLAGRL